MGANNIPSAVPNTVIPANDHNSIRTAMIGDYVPRNASANPADAAGSMGQSAFRWLQGFIRTLFIGTVGDNISIEADSSDCIIKVGGVERARIPQADGLLPPGMIAPYSGDTDPQEWLLCDGREINRTTYARLYAAVGDRFGDGNGTTTFNIPDGRGRFLRGKDHALARDPDAGSRTAMAGGGATGDNVGSVQDDAMLEHTHIINGQSLQSTSDTGDGINGFISGGSKSDGGADEAFTNNNAGSSTETRPKNFYVNYIIKT